MKFTTLITRYKNLGYEPKNLDDKIELECLINWIYEKYNIFIYVTYTDHISQKCLKKYLKNINSFAAHKIWHCNTDKSNTIYSDKHFATPFESKFNTVKEIYHSIKFLFH